MAETYPRRSKVLAAVITLGLVAGITMFVAFVALAPKVFLASFIVCLAIYGIISTYNGILKELES